MDDSKIVIESSEEMEHSEVTDDTLQEGAGESETNPTTVESQNLSSVEQDSSVIPQLPAALPAEIPLEHDASVILQLPAELPTVVSVEQDSSVTHQLPADLSTETPELSVPTSASVSQPLDIEDSDKTSTSKESSTKRRRSVTPEIDSGGSMSSPSGAVKTVDTSLINVQIRKVRDVLQESDALAHGSKKRKIGESGSDSEEGSFQPDLNVPTSAAGIGPKSDTEEKTPSPDGSTDSRPQEEYSNPDEMHQSSVDMPLDEQGGVEQQSDSGDNSGDQSERSSDSGRKVAVLRDSSNPEERSNVQNPTSEEDEEYMEEEGMEEGEEGIEEEGAEECEEGIEEEEGEEREEGIEEEEGMEEEEEQSSVSSEEKQSSSNMAHAAIRESESRANVETAVTGQNLSDSLARIYPNKKAKKSFTSSKSTGFQRNLADEALASRNLPATQDPVVPMEEDSGKPSLQRQDSEPFSIEGSTSGERSEVNEDLEPPHIDIHAGQPSSSRHEPLVDPNGSANDGTNAPSGPNGETEGKKKHPKLIKTKAANARHLLLSVLEEIMKINEEKDQFNRFRRLFKLTAEGNSDVLNRALRFELFTYKMVKQTTYHARDLYLSREKTLERFTEEAFDRILSIVISILMTVVQVQYSLLYNNVMTEYQKFRSAYESFSQFWRQHNVAEIQNEASRNRVIYLIKLIQSVVLTTMTAFKELLMHVGQFAEQKTIDEFEELLLEEDKKHLRLEIP